MNKSVYYIDSGAIAQLGECLLGVEEVRGSNPLSSTKFLFFTEEI